MPGNPVSSLVTYLIFVKTNINKLFGQKFYETVIATLTTNLNKKDGKRHFARGILSYNLEMEKYEVKSSGLMSSGNMFGMSVANCLIVIKEDRLDPKTGEKIECIRI